VAFVGVDQQIYTARWTVRRARNSPSGELQKTEMMLFRGNVCVNQEGQIEQGGKKTQVQAVIQEKIGLSFEQFTRAVLLAQNDFATFLKAKKTTNALRFFRRSQGPNCLKIFIGIHERHSGEARKTQRPRRFSRREHPTSRRRTSRLDVVFAEANQALASVNQAIQSMCETSAVVSGSRNRFAEESSRAQEYLESKTRELEDAVHCCSTGLQNRNCCRSRPDGAPPNCTPNKCSKAKAELLLCEQKHREDKSR